MNCEHATNLISARIDGEIDPAQQSLLEEHLASCEACRAALATFTGQDAVLSRAFAPRRAAADAVARAVIRRVRQDPGRAKTWPVWLNSLLAAAAGFGVAVIVFQPWKTKLRNVAPAVSVVGPDSRPASIGQLALATGAIQVLPPGSNTWEVMATGGVLAAKSRVRTGDNVRCEFRMADGSEVRLNAGTEVVFAGARSLDLASGQLWSTVAPQRIPFQVAVATATVTALGTQFDVLAEPQQATVTVVSGSTRVSGGGGETVVESGHWVKIVKGVPGQSSRSYNLLLATRWVNDLLVLKGRDNAELQKRIDDLFASIGEAKMGELYEEEIRSLGDHCVIPLTRYIQSDRSRQPGDQEKRAKAARILSDLAQPWSIPDMIPMLADSDSAIRYNAARALKRLTGFDQGASADVCRDNLQRSKEAFEEWRRWWSQNKGRFPTGPAAPIGP